MKISDGVPDSDNDGWCDTIDPCPYTLGITCCGDGNCNSGETCETCPGDCGECPNSPDPPPSTPPSNDDPDKDGVPNDGTDWCPNIMGHPLNHGCPRCPEVPENYGYNDCKWYEYLIKGGEGRLSDYYVIEIKNYQYLIDETEKFRERSRWWKLGWGVGGAAVVKGLLGKILTAVGVKATLLTVGITIGGIEAINRTVIESDIKKYKGTIDTLIGKWWGTFDYTNHLRIQANNCAFCGFKLKQPPDPLPWEE